MIEDSRGDCYVLIGWMRTCGIDTGSYGMELSRCEVLDS